MSDGILLTVAEPGWRDRRVLPVASLSASWSVEALGVLSAQLPADAVHRLGFAELLGKWVAWDGGALGLWGGVLRRTPSETRSGTLELSCDSFRVLFRGIATPRTYKLATAPAGALWIRGVSDAVTDRRLWLDSYAADEDGPVLALEWRGDDLADVSDQLARLSDHEWDATLNSNWTIGAAFRRRLGRDLTGSVVLADGYNVVAGQVAPSLDPLVNAIVAIPDDRQWERTQRAVAVDAGSIATYGRVEVTRRYEGVFGPDSLYTRAKQDVERESGPAIPATVVVALAHPVNGSIRQGDTVRYWSARQNARYAFRVTSRAVDVGEGTVTYGGDCEAVS